MWKNALTGQSLDSFNRPVLVGEIHEGIAGFEQDLVGHGKLPLAEELLQVLHGHRRTQIAHIEFVHGLYENLYVQIYRRARACNGLLEVRKTR